MWAWGVAESRWGSMNPGSVRFHEGVYLAALEFWEEKLQVLLRFEKEVEEAGGWGPG